MTLRVIVQNVLDNWCEEDVQMGDVCLFLLSSNMPEGKRQIHQKLVKIGGHQITLLAAVHPKGPTAPLGTILLPP
eukprot:1158756-Pelagomonas_calceolata.AAC.16